MTESEASAFVSAWSRLTAKQQKSLLTQSLGTTCARFLVFTKVVDVNRFEFNDRRLRRESLESAATSKSHTDQSSLIASL